MDDSSMNRLIRLINELKQVENASEKDLTDYILSCACQLHLLGSLGLCPIYNIRETLVLEELEKNGVKLWLLSEDTERADQVDYEAIDLYDNYLLPFKVEGLNER